MHYMMPVQASLCMSMIRNELHMICCKKHSVTLLEPVCLCTPPRQAVLPQQQSKKVLKLRSLT